jgi:hypothetical protein
MDEYEVLMLGLETTKNMGVNQLKMFINYNLIVNQVRKK